MKVKKRSFRYISLSLLFFVLFSSCSKEDQAVESCFTEVIIERIEQAEGEIRLIGSAWIIDVDATGSRYLACNFPEHLQVPDTLIVFDADVYQTPPNMRLAGTPIIITHLY